MEHAWSFEGRSVILCDHRGLATCVTYSKIPVAVTRSGLDFSNAYFNYRYAIKCLHRK